MFTAVLFVIDKKKGKPKYPFTIKFYPDLQILADFYFSKNIPLPCESRVLYLQHNYLSTVKK